MAHITTRHDTSQSILAGLRGLLDTCRSIIQRHRAFERIYSELSSLSDRELADIGISRSQIVHVAWESVHRG